MTERYIYLGLVLLGAAINTWNSSSLARFWGLVMALAFCALWQKADT
jgi:hypothetical protein